MHFKAFPFLQTYPRDKEITLNILTKLFSELRLKWMRLT